MEEVQLCFNDVSSAPQSRNFVTKCDLLIFSSRHACVSSVDIFLQYFVVWTDMMEDVQIKIKKMYNIGLYKIRYTIRVLGFLYGSNRRFCLAGCGVLPGLVVVLC